MPASNYANLVLQAVSLTASGAVTKERFVKHNGAACGLGERAIGVAAYTAATTEDACAYTGIIRVVAGDTVAIGGDVMSDATGRAIPFVQNSAETYCKVGVAHTAGTVGAIMLVQTAV